MADKTSLYFPPEYAEYAKDRLRSIAEHNHYQISDNLRDSTWVFASHFNNILSPGTAEFNEDLAMRLYTRLDEKQYINWIEGLPCFDSKQCNYRLMKQLYEQNKCSIQTGKEIIPRQYDLTHDDECRMFLDSTKSSDYYMMKGAEAQMGEDIYIAQNKDVNCHTKTLRIDKDKTVDITKVKIQAQRLVRPLLLNGYPSTFRIYIMICYTQQYGFMCFYYHPGYAYTSSNKFDTTNYNVSNFLSNTGKRIGWEATDINEYLKTDWMTSTKEGSFYHKVSNILKVVMESFKAKLKGRPRSWALLGCDILVDSDLNCYWIDPNIAARFSPWAQHQWSSAMKIVEIVNNQKSIVELDTEIPIKQDPFDYEGNKIVSTGNWYCVYIEKMASLTKLCGGAIRGKYIKTNKCYVDKDGVNRTIYMKGSSFYVKRKHPTSNTFIYKKITINRS